MSTESVIETNALTKIYNGQTAVEELTFSVEEGEIFARNRIKFQWFSIL